MTLQLGDHLHRALMATPCRVVGGYRTDDLNIDLAFPQFDDHRKTALARIGTFVVSFEADGVEKVGELPVLRGFFSLAGLIADLLSLRYGKRIEFLGFYQSNGHFMQPQNVPVPPQNPVLRMHPFVSDKPRVDFSPVLRDHAEREQEDEG